MTPVRIAYIINSLEGGGAALPVPAVIRVMREAGAEVKLFALSRRNGRAAAALEAAGIVYEVCDAGKSDHLRASLWLWRQLKAYRPTLLWTSLTQATVIGQLLGAMMRVPVVSWQHNAFLKPANRALLAVTRRLTRLWVADSESVAELTRTRLGIDPARIIVWPLFHADPDAPVAKACGPDEIFRFGSLGRLHPNKGYDILVQALGRLAADAPELSQRFQVLIGGEGAEHDRLTALARDLGVTNLTLAGYQSDPRQFLAGVHAYLQPSRAEGLCIAAHEAMQAGLPTVVSTVGEMQYSVEDRKTGLVVPPGDVEALAGAIRSLAEDPARAHAMGLAARQHILTRFSVSRFNAAGRLIMDQVAGWRQSGERSA